MTIRFQPYHRGVYCDDESIMYPVKPDTITHGLLAAVTISCTVIIVSSCKQVKVLSRCLCVSVCLCVCVCVCVCERHGMRYQLWIMFRNPNTTQRRSSQNRALKKKNMIFSSLTLLCLCLFIWLFLFLCVWTWIQVSSGEAYLVYSKRIYSNSNFNQYVVALYKVLGTFLFGAAVSQSLTDLAKFTIGRPRPNFLSVCAPLKCEGYTRNITCTGEPQDVTESR